MRYNVIRVCIITLSFIACVRISAQEKQLPVERPPYNRKEEIIHANKRYLLYNNYLTFGAGYLGSNIHKGSQNMIGADFHFHIRREYFQLGVLMSGLGFLTNNNVQAHLGYGYRKEHGSYNLAGFLGPSYIYGVKTLRDTSGQTFPEIYEAIGAYLCLQGVFKFTYDLGVGVELFGEYSVKQRLLGFKLIAFFSGAYRGVKKNYNPNVRSENIK